MNNEKKELFSSFLFFFFIFFFFSFHFSFFNFYFYDAQTKVGKTNNDNEKNEKKLGGWVRERIFSRRDRRCDLWG